MNKIAKSILVTALKTAVTISVIYFIIDKIGFDKIKSAILGSNLKMVGIGVSLFIISIFIGAVQWRELLVSRGVKIDIKTTITVYFTGIFFNNFMLGMVAGDSYKVARLHLEKQKVEGSVAATFFDRISGLLVISIFALIGGAYLFISRGAEQKISGVILIVALFASILFGFVAISLSKRLQKWVLSLVAKISKESVRERITDILKALFIDRNNREEITVFKKVFGYSVVIQFLRVVVHIAAAAALGMFSWGSVHYFFIIIPIIAFLTIIPLPLGVKEAIGGTLFVAAGFDSDKAVVMEFIATLMGIAGSLVGGLFFIIDRRHVS